MEHNQKMPSKTNLSNPKPGQKYEKPVESDPLLKFYKSTLKQKKGNSQMALKWCLEHGVLSTKKATEVDAMFKMQKLAIK